MISDPNSGAKCVKCKFYTWNRWKGGYFCGRAAVWYQNDYMYAREVVFPICVHDIKHHDFIKDDYFVQKEDT